MKSFKSWLVLTESKLQAICKRCKKIELSMGVQSLKSHVDGKKHKEIVATVSVFFKKPTKTQSKLVLVKAAKEMQVVVLNSQYLN